MKKTMLCVMTISALSLSVLSGMAKAAEDEEESSQDKEAFEAAYADCTARAEGDDVEFKACMDEEGFLEEEEELEEVLGEE